MAIVKWDPFRDITTMRDELDRMFRPMLWTSSMTDGGWAPACDIHETDNEVVVDCELPGVEAKDIDVNIEGDTMTIRGERKMAEEVKEKDYHRIERAYGSFVRVLMLPSEVDSDKANATYDNGVLRITIPKMVMAKPKAKKIAIKETAKVGR